MIFHQWWQVLPLSTCFLRKQPPEVFWKKSLFLEISQNSLENPLCQRLFFNKVAGLRPSNLFEKEPLAQVFICEMFEISKNTFFTEHLWSTASVLSSARFFSPNGIKFPRQRIFKPDGRSININCSSTCWFMACQSLHLSTK